MRVFRAEAYAQIPKQLRRKLNDHFKLGHFVHHGLLDSRGKKGYRMILSSGQVVECANVVFVEGSPDHQPPLSAQKAF